MTDGASWRGRRLHFVGIGGEGMSGLALVAHSLGAELTGSDRRESERIDGLRELGIEIALGHDPGNVPPDGELVYSAGIPGDNPERARAHELGLDQKRRGELLGEVSRLRRCIAVAGAHGKSTTTAMIVHILAEAGQRPGYVVGGELRSTGRNADWGEEPWLVVEADESDRSFLFFDPDIAVVTNVAHEHHREYPTEDDVRGAFRSFLALAPQAVLPDLPDVLALRDGPVVRFEAKDVEVFPGGSRFRWREHEVRLRIPGEHNARNAAAALEAASLAGVAVENAVESLSGFRGVVGRIERLGESDEGAEIYLDRANHPNEVDATLAALRTLGPERLIAVIQPYNYTRLRFTGRGLGESLAGADLAVVLPPHRTADKAEGEDPESAMAIVEATSAAGQEHAIWQPGLDEAEAHLRSELRPGDLCVAMGAGGVAELANRLAS